jgi:hypothetical protein
MKPKKYTVLFWIVLLSFVLSIALNPLLAQNTPSEQPYYVIVGGFVSHDNAEHFTAQLLAQNYPARYALNVNRKLYYVYVRLTADRQYAKQLAHRLRVETKFQDAWIYNGALDGNGVLEDAVLADAHRVVEPVNLVERPVETETLAPVVTPTVVIEPTTITTPEAPAAASKRFVFQVTNAVDNQPVDGVVHLLQSEPDAHFRTYNTNQEIFVSAPESGKLIVVCNLMGYKLAKRAFSYADPVKSIKGASMGGAEEVIIPIKLVPMAKGDYMELEHVKFVDNSAILTPTSEPELMALTSLMSNPRRKIKLFGHTHSRADCDIISLGNSTQFFSFDPANNYTRHGSAKELSHQRAETVKAYLVSKGVDPGRIATKGYGAMLAIYEHESANERIEVQITRN